MNCDKCKEPVIDSENIFEKEFSENKQIAVHRKCAKKTGGLDYFHGLRHTIWPAVAGEYSIAKKILGKRFSK